MNEAFKLWVPMDIIKGAKDKKGNKVMIVEGVASTMSEDMDGEILDPNGFDLSYLLDNGFINWHHATKDKPGTIIGEPIKAWVQDNKLHVRAQLYDWQPIAKDVYDLAENLQKGGSNRRLGWSIEGVKRQVDPLNKKFIRKSAVTGIAISPSPKNRGTYVDISKGFDYEYDLYKFGDTDAILDIKKGDTTIFIDDHFNIRKIKNGKEITEKNFISIENAINIYNIEKGIQFEFISKEDSIDVLNKLKETLEKF